MIRNKEYVYTIKVTVNLNTGNNNDFTEKEIEDSFEDFQKEVKKELECVDIFKVKQGYFSIEDVEIK